MTLHILDSIKANATAITSIVTFVVSVVGGFIVIDDRYAHAADYVQQQNSQTRTIQQFRVDTAIQLEQLQLNSIDDKIFYLEQKVNRSVADEAQLNRFERQRQDVVEKIRTLQRSNKLQ